MLSLSHSLRERLRRSVEFWGSVFRVLRNLISIVHKIITHIIRWIRLLFLNNILIIMQTHIITNPLAPLSYSFPLKIIALHCSQGLCSSLLRSLSKSVDEKLAYWAIWASNILLWIVRTSTLETTRFMYSSSFCYAISILSIIASKLEF